MAIYEETKLVMEIDSNHEDWVNQCWYDRLTGQPVTLPDPVLEIVNPPRIIEDGKIKISWVNNSYYKLDSRYDTPPYNYPYSNGDYQVVQDNDWKRLNIELQYMIDAPYGLGISIYPVYKSDLGRAMFQWWYTGIDSQTHVQIYAVRDPSDTADENTPYTVLMTTPGSGFAVTNQYLRLYMSVHKNQYDDVQIKLYPANTPMDLMNWRAINIDVFKLNRASIDITPTYNFQTGSGPGSMFANARGVLTEIRAPEGVMADVNTPYRMYLSAPNGTRDIRISAHKDNPANIKVYEVIQHEINSGDTKSDTIYDKKHTIQFIPESILTVTDDEWSLNNFDDGMWLSGLNYGKPTGQLAGKNTWSEWHLIPEERPSVKMAPLKSNTIEIPGINGSIDFTEAVSGRPMYGNRSGSWSFLVDNGHKDWSTIYSEIANYLHGKKVRVVLLDDPGYFYEGRVQINEWKSDQWNSKITLNYDLAPFKKESIMALTPWYWSKFNLETGIIRNYSILDIRNGKVASINCPTSFGVLGDPYTIGDYCSYEGNCYRAIKNTSGTEFEYDDWINLGKNIGAGWAYNVQYYKDDYCSYPAGDQYSKLYRAKGEATKGTWVPAEWEDVSASFTIAETSEYMAYPEFDIQAYDGPFTVGVGVGSVAEHSFTVPEDSDFIHYKPPTDFRIYGKFNKLIFDGWGIVRVFYRGGRL